MPTYILQKDLPDAKSGDEYVLQGDMYHNTRSLNQDSPVIEHNSYFTWQVQAMSEWFKLKEEESLYVLNAKKLLLENGYTLYKDGKGEAKTKFSRTDMSDRSIQEVDNEVLKYTEYDMRKCFDEGFKLSKDYPKSCTPFEDYINSLNK